MHRLRAAMRSFRSLGLAALVLALAMGALAQDAEVRACRSPQLDYCDCRFAPKLHMRRADLERLSSGRFALRSLAAGGRP